MPTITPWAQTQLSGRHSRPTPAAQSHQTHLVPGPAHDGREDGSGSVVSREPGLAETRSIITDQSGALLIITHGCRGEEHGFWMGLDQTEAAVLLLTGISQKHKHLTREKQPVKQTAWTWSGVDPPGPTGLGELPN